MSFFFSSVFCPFFYPFILLPLFILSFLHLCFLYHLILFSFFLFSFVIIFILSHFCPSYPFNYFILLPFFTPLFFYSKYSISSLIFSSSVIYFFYHSGMNLFSFIDAPTLYLLTIFMSFLLLFLFAPFYLSVLSTFLCILIFIFASFFFIFPFLHFYFCFFQKKSSSLSRPLLFIPHFTL